MKRSVLFASIMMIACASFGQFRQTASDVTLISPQPMNELSPAATTSGYRGGIEEMFIWYASTESNIYSDDQIEFIWDMNGNATTADSIFNYVIVSYPKLIAWDAVDETSTIPWQNVINLTVDTIWIQIGHENNSGMLDTLRVRIVELNNNGRPTNTVLWEELMTTDTSFTGGQDWLNSVFLPLFPDILLTGPFGVRVDYFGPIQDTFGIVAGFHQEGTCGQGSFPKAVESLFATNSWRQYSQYAQAGLLPDAQDNDIYYDCNSSGGYEEGDDGEHLTQNINFGVSLTIEHNVSVEELPQNLHSVKNFPNPFSEISHIEYTLDGADQVSLEVYDLTGAVVFRSEEGRQMAGTHTIQVDGSALAEGIYYYRLNVNGGTVTRKMVLAR